MALLWATLIAAMPIAQDAQVSKQFVLTGPSEVVATITAGCARCDWSTRDREAAVLEVLVDGAYSQHVVLTRGEKPSPYRVLLGTLAAGAHEIVVRRDPRRSSRNAGPASIGNIEITSFTADSPEYPWLSRAPFLRARPGALERFSDVPLLMYAERDVPGEAGGSYRYQYTVIFSHEDGGTAADRLMATWGRTADIEFVYGLTAGDAGAPPREMIQAQGHRWIEFNGPRAGAHPVLWVSTDNNMVADHGPDDVVRFAPAPKMIALGRQSREAVMDAEPWTYAVASAEAMREGRIDSTAQAGSGKLPDPRRYATIEACADVTSAVVAFDIGVRGRDSQTAWYPTDRNEPAFRIARGGCFRGGAPLPANASPQDIVGLRVRAYSRPSRAGGPPPAASVTLRSVNRVFLLDSDFVPRLAPVAWSGEMAVPADREAMEVMLSRLQ